MTPGARAAAALALAAALARPALADEPGLRPMPLEALLPRVEGARGTLTARGLEIALSGNAFVPLPFPAEEVELDLEADGPVLLSWAARSGGRAARFLGPPWRYARVPRAPGTLRLDLRVAPDWTPSAQSVLFLRGGGTVVVHAARASPVPADRAEALAAQDRALLWMPESVGHTTINSLTPSYWSASRGTRLVDVVAAASLAVLVAVLAAPWLRGGRPSPGRALAAAALFAIASWDAHFLVRFLPVAKLSLEPDPEARIRDGYPFDPELGVLAALARATVRPDERVGAMAGPKNWFDTQVLCFDLAPRRCAVVRPGEREYLGLAGVERLRPDEIDVIVALGGGPLPDGFVPVGAP